MFLAVPEGSALSPSHFVFAHTDLLRLSHRNILSLLPRETSVTILQRMPLKVHNARSDPGQWHMELSMIGMHRT
jgi:hypothetical protein